MKIVLKDKVLMVERNEGSELWQTMSLVSWDDDKNLITCNVLEWTEKYPEWTIIITGKYSLNKMIYKAKEYNFLEEIDIIGRIEE